jgi:hypothetical protein
MDGTAATPSGSTTTGPASFSELPGTAWSGDSSAPTPTSDSPETASASAATTEPPVETSTPDGTTPGNGEPPKERWADILSNARAKEREAAIAEYRQKVGWAEQINQQDLHHAMSIAQKLRVDAGPDAFVEGLRAILAEGQQNPQIAAALRSFQGRALAQLRQQQAAPQGPDLHPIRVQLENGQEVGLYSADQITALRDQWLAQVKQEFQPVTKTIETLQAERAAAEQAQRVTHFASSTYQDMTTWPGMDSKENQRIVAHALTQARIDPNNPQEVQLAAERAWRTHVAPQQSRQAEAKLLDSLKTKAAASTGVNPGSAAPSATRAVTKFADLSADAWR